ncbi:MAG: hypothetical protein ABS76_02645 [Pelagibacterium sp. SCN 64-44]|nr:MAG: hypothetical protein ABS76_02645 [Pelagibacterium sp. SCN 64-44]
MSVITEPFHHLRRLGILVVMLALFGAMPALGQSNADLNRLSFNPFIISISPAFSPEVTHYRIVSGVNLNVLQLTARPEDSSARVSVRGVVQTGYFPLPLDPGENNFVIDVESADSTITKQYYLTVVRDSTAEALLPAQVGQFKEYRLVVPSGTGVPTLVGGSFPPGMSLSRTGARLIFGGTPEQKGLYSFAIQGTDPASPIIHYYSILITGGDEQADAAQQSAQVLAESFASSKSAMLAANMFVPGIVDRRQMQGASDAFEGSFSPLDSGLALAFAGSLASVEAARQLATGGIAPDHHTNPFNAWIRGTGQIHNPAGTDRWGRYGVISLGADYMPSQQALFGLSAHFDSLSDPTDTNTTVSGNGWMAGPYASFEIARGVFWDMSLFYGRSTNDLQIDDWTGAFASERWLFDATISGQIELDELLTLTPSLNLGYGAEHADGFVITDSVGTTRNVDGFTSTRLAVTTGLDIARHFELDDGGRLTPRAGIFAALSDGSGSNFSGTVSAGMTWKAPSVWTLDGSVRAGMDGNGLRTLGGSASIKARF